MKNILDFLLYGGPTREEFTKIRREVDASNRRSIVAYASVSSCAFFAMAMFSAMGPNTVSKNRLFYVIGALLMAAMLMLNLYISDKRHRVITTAAFSFVAAMLMIGIALAVSSKEDVTASYMVFLFVAPLLFTLPPLHTSIIVLASDLAYILIMLRIQEHSLFLKNLLNAILYGVVSVFVSSIMTSMRVRKFQTDYMNRVLMETDQLTGMLNRHSYMQRIEFLRKSSSVVGVKFCVFDVNGLKQINDTLGHTAGDELILGTATTLNEVFSPYGYCYRIGGDEFVAILTGNTPSPEALKQKLQEKSAQFRGSSGFGLSISAGIVVGAQGETVEELIRKADAAMYEAKAEHYRQIGVERRKHHPTAGE